MKILQIVESLHKGAVENWLVRVFNESTKHRPNVEWTFFCILDSTGDLDEIVLQNGGKIIKSPISISNKVAFLRNLRKQVRSDNYDVIHAHHDYLNSFYALAFWRSKALKISHIHNTDRHLPIQSKLLNNILIPQLKFFNNILYNKLIGISQDTIREFKYSFNGKYDESIIYYGIDLTKFRILHNSSDILTGIGIPNTARVLIYIGRFTELKNPSFVVSILHELSKENDEYYCLFIGEGDELSAINQKVEEYNLQAKVRILPWVSDPEKYFQIADVFVFPRKLKPIEGFGMVMLEAQAAGINIIVSTGVSKETIVVNQIVTILDSISDAKLWANEIMNLKNSKKITDSVDLIQHTQFNIENSALRLISFYETN